MWNQNPIKLRCIQMIYFFVTKPQVTLRRNALKDVDIYGSFLNPKINYYNSPALNITLKGL